MKENILMVIKEKRTKEKHVIMAERLNENIYIVAWVLDDNIKEGKVEADGHFIFENKNLALKKFQEITGVGQ